MLHCFNHSEQTGICPVCKVCPVAWSQTHGCPRLIDLCDEHTHNTHTQTNTAMWLYFSIISNKTERSCILQNNLLVYLVIFSCAGDRPWRGPGSLQHRGWQHRWCLLHQGWHSVSIITPSPPPPPHCSLFFFPFFLVLLLFSFFFLFLLLSLSLSHIRIILCLKLIFCDLNLVFLIYMHSFCTRHEYLI